MYSLPGEPPLRGKVLVVIGGTSGIGISAVRAFGSAGARVVGVGLAPMPELPTDASQAVRWIEADARLPETAPAAIRQAEECFGGFHGLYHVAGGSGRKWGDGPLHGITDEGWAATLGLNLTSVMYSNRAAVRYWLEKGQGGTILNLGSVLAASPSPGFFSTHTYATAKAGIEGFTKACAAYYAPHNIRVNVLAPGLTATPMSQRAQNDPAITAFLKTKQPLDGGRMGVPEDLDAIAVYFMSDFSRYVTGQVLAVDGGWSVTEGQIPKQP